MSDLPYPDDKGQTHYAGCWRERGHHNCAIARIKECERQRDEAWSEVEAWRWWMAETMPDEIAGIDLHERAYEIACDRGRTETEISDYLAACLSAISAARRGS